MCSWWLLTIPAFHKNHLIAFKFPSSNNHFIKGNIDLYSLCITFKYLLHFGGEFRGWGNICMQFQDFCCFVFSSPLFCHRHYILWISDGRMIYNKNSTLSEMAMVPHHTPPQFRVLAISLLFISLENLNYFKNLHV